VQIAMKGWSDPAWTATVSCRGCGAELVVTRPDLQKVRFGSVVPGERDSWFVIQIACPDCKHNTTLADPAEHHEDIPQTKDLRVGRGL